MCPLIDEIRQLLTVLAEKWKPIIVEFDDIGYKNLNGKFVFGITADGFFKPHTEANYHELIRIVNTLPLLVLLRQSVINKVLINCRDFVKELVNE